MSENKTFIDELLKRTNDDRKIALATVVKVSGSAYKREGSKMLIDENGRTNGVISGGCLERDVAEVSLQVIESGLPTLKQYHLDEDLVWGLGLGCPGTVDIYIEPVKQTSMAYLDASGLHEPFQDAKKIDPFQKWVKCLQQEKEGVLATVMNTSSSKELFQGSRVFITTNNQVGQFFPQELNRTVCDIAYQKINQQSPKSESRTIYLSNGEWVDIFFDVNLPTYELIIFGAGHDAIPLSKLSLQLGFKTTVVDPRPAYATTERFPGAEIISVDAEKYRSHVVIGPRTYTVIMNHHLERDQASLEFALNSDSPYVGVLGPRSRCNKILDSIQMRDEQPLSQLHNPIGLDIGAESSEEIALSILSEILAVRNGHAGGFLRSRKGIESNRIHQPLVLDVRETKSDCLI
ncbi:XdhC family protein [Neobacillus drentensis]|uniref:XdhC family protein n=1 Tax=Neobacillus drentensis TaxID=220684 RepID=UPI003000E4B2